MSYPYYDEVQRAYNDLKLEGKIKPRATTEEVEHDKGLITQRAGYYSNLRDATIGVLEKTTGNNYMGYSVDILIRTDGVFWDVVTDNGSEAVPVNGGPSGPDPELIPRWRKPTKELAQMPEDGNGNGGNGEEPPPVTDDALQQIIEAITLSEQRVQENVTAQGEETRELIRHYADQVDYWATIIAAVWLKQQANDPDISDAVILRKAKKLVRAMVIANGRQTP
jgi:hypothetical protein